MPTTASPMWVLAGVAVPGDRVLPAEVAFAARSPVYVCAASRRPTAVRRPCAPSHGHTTSHINCVHYTQGWPLATYFVVFQLELVVGPSDWVSNELGVHVVLNWEERLVVVDLQSNWQRTEAVPTVTWAR